MLFKVIPCDARLNVLSLELAVIFWSANVKKRKY